MKASMDAVPIDFAATWELIVTVRRFHHVSEIARRTRVTRQATGSMVEKLTRAGLVDVTTDGYLKFVEISAPGRRRVSQCHRAIASVLRDMETALSPPERIELAALRTRADRCLRPPTSPTWWLDD